MQKESDNKHSSQSSPLSRKVTNSVEKIVSLTRRVRAGFMSHFETASIKAEAELSKVPMFELPGATSLLHAAADRRNVR